MGWRIRAARIRNWMVRLFGAHGWLNAVPEIRQPDDPLRTPGASRRKIDIRLIPMTHAAALNPAVP